MCLCSLCLSRILCVLDPKLSIIRVFPVWYSMFRIASARHISHGIIARGLRTSTTDLSLKRKNPILGWRTEGRRKRKKKWIKEWLARLQLRSSTKATTHHGRTRCTSTCSGMDTGAMSTDQMTQHPIRHTETSWPRTVGKQSSLLFCILGWRTTFELYSGCKNTKGCLGKSENDFRQKPESCISNKSWATCNNWTCRLLITPRR